MKDQLARYRTSFQLLAVLAAVDSIGDNAKGEDCTSLCWPSLIVRAPRRRISKSRGYAMLLCARCRPMLTLRAC